MAATEGWRDRLGRTFQRQLGEKNEKTNDESKNILQTKHGWIYAWNQRRRNAFAVNVCDDAGVSQNFVPTCPPLYEIHSLVCNPAGQRLALVGRNGVNVMELPKRPRKVTSAVETDGQEEVENSSLCSSVEIAERFFLSNPNCRVVQVKWHPQSETSTHLIILFSNNYLRVYDSLSASTPVQTYQLGPVPVFRLSPSSGASSFGVALGDTAVDFDFGRPAPAAEKFDPKLVDRFMEKRALVWPVYVLGGSGDVFSMWITDPKFSVKSEVKGPLTMHPPAEDNYGVDATSIVCLPSVPPLLAIATSSGMLYHAIVLDNDRNEDVQDYSSEASWSSSKRSKTLTGPDVSLYVYESVELELIPNSSPNAETLEGDFTCPIRLHRDPTTNLRYHCSHSAGVHTVALPVISQLEYLSEGNLNESVPDIFSTIESQTCIIEHLICTRPLSNSPSSPVIGLGVVYGHSLGGTTILCLTDPYELITLPLVPTYLDRIPHLLAEPRDIDETANSMTSSLTSPTAKEPFDQHIRQMLQRKISNPIFKSNAAADLTPEECIQLLNRSTRILREEYIEKLDLAREKIQERVKVLHDLKAQQLVEIKMMNKMKSYLSAKAEGLAEKYEELNDTQETIVKRMERILRALLKQTPMLSDAERNLGKELKSMEEKVERLTNCMQQIRVKQSYQSSLIARHQTNLKLQRPAANLSDTQLKRIKEFLAEESQTLVELTEKMKMVQRSLGL